MAFKTKSTTIVINRLFATIANVYGNCPTARVVAFKKKTMTENNENGTA